jgi:hypothetical protein
LPAVGWIQGQVVKRNVGRRMKIGSDRVIFIVFYTHNDDTLSAQSESKLQLRETVAPSTARSDCRTKHCSISANRNKEASPEAPHSSQHLGTLGRSKGMRETTVEWTEFALRLITYV